MASRYDEKTLLVWLNIQEYHCEEKGEFGKCSHCGADVQSVFVDESFSHEYGTEHSGFIGSPCCEEAVIPERHIEDAKDGEYDDEVREHLRVSA